MRQMMHIDTQTGLLKEAIYYPTTHHDTRSCTQDLSLVVIHAISLPPGQFGGNDVISLFQGILDCELQPYYAQLKGLRVSAHLFIRRDGSSCQFVPFHLRAWHAGVSRFANRISCNDFSIGIELEGTDTSAYTDAQYDTLNCVLIALRAAYPSLSNAPVVGHSDISPYRKTDPGLGFNWAAIQRH
jgi:AmpD protein